MSTLATQRAALAAALAAAGIPAGDPAGQTAPPCALIFGAGIDVGSAHVGRGQVPARFRITLVAGLYDEYAAGLDLATMQGDAIAAVRDMAGWQLIESGPDTITAIAGGQYYAADLIVAAMIDL